jgi:hypothetical protein
MVLPAAS